MNWFCKFALVLGGVIVMATMFRAGGLWHLNCQEQSNIEDSSTKVEKPPVDFPKPAQPKVEGVTVVARGVLKVKRTWEGLLDSTPIEVYLDLGNGKKIPVRIEDDRKHTWSQRLMSLSRYIGEEVEITCFSEELDHILRLDLYEPSGIIMIVGKP